MEKRDPDYDRNRKMAEVLRRYRMSTTPGTGTLPGRVQPVITVSVAAKPGAVNRGTPLRIWPRPGLPSEVGRDYKNVRHRPRLILAALDLYPGEINTKREEGHRRQEFVVLLKRLDDLYPKEATIRGVLYNHSAHSLGNAIASRAMQPNRFRYVHMAKHRFLPKIVETDFSKMARLFFRHIRVSSKRNSQE